MEHLFPEIDKFHLFLNIMVLIALIVFVTLYFINAGYGMLYTKKWGRGIGNKVGWVLMEAPVFILMAVMWWMSPRRFDLTPLLFFLIFQLHYFQRSFIFPLLIKGKNRMPLTIMLSGMLFNTLNAYIQGGWIFYISAKGTYPESWIYTPQFVIGVAIFFIGMAINLNSDHIIRNLRKPGDTAHYIPRGGMFRYVSSANYFGELLEWVGFAVFTWSYAGAVFAIWTAANLVPRAAKIHKRYKEEFGEEFTRLKVKRIIPFIY